jgi:transposase
MRFVPIKTVDQLDLQALHRVRDRLVSCRTGVINQLRAFLLERGITVRQGRASLRAHMPGILADAEQTLSPGMQRIVQQLWHEWQDLEQQITAITDEIGDIAAAHIATPTS